MHILFIGAHPDDLEILCGGTIRRCVEQGHEVWMAVATNGNVGTPDLSCEEIARIRNVSSGYYDHFCPNSGMIFVRVYSQGQERDPPR